MVFKQAKEKKRWRLGYHIMAPSGWINDPNGLVQYQGMYHVFFQHYPNGVEWGPMHWGHVASRDLVHWKHYPIALTPGDSFDRDGCFSGSAIEKDGKLCLIYTGHRNADDAKKSSDQVQCLAVSKDGINFEKSPENPIIATHPKEGSGDFRDPKVWRRGDHFYLIAGTCKDRVGKVVLYRSSDLKNWTYLGVLAQSGKNLGYMWECPDFFELDGKHILMISPQGIESENDLYQNLYQTGYFVGNFDYEHLQFNYGHFKELDNGHDFYAAQSFQDHSGRRIVIGWMDMWESPMPEQAEGWAGALTLPRELRLGADGNIRMTPVAELLHLRKNERMNAENLQVSGSHTLNQLDDDLLELELLVDLHESDADCFGIKLRCGKTEETVLEYDAANCVLTLDRSKSGTGSGGTRRTKLPKRDSLKLRIYLDRSSVEVFVNDGEKVMTSRIYPTEQNQGVQLFASGGRLTVQNMHSWSLKDIWNEE
ncbi:MAG: glycoside hydrolase family 32 protein [Sporolactobacillus sp.]|uniref:glycoside hydrolase family 32 protein n=1 Tax=Sporolactobacillus sp. STSJ-5 TaxID=2965076 RepID=UPI0021075A75|nr:glycoside hydrolase family 32 protein [Sporolactobacillus sp. STSJ-5]MCQ2009731.1 glycoside hydrolase family 32 protein [Sporolactobacillus sp. STSJ-5]